MNNKKSRQYAEPRNVGIFFALVNFLSFPLQYSLRLCIVQDLREPLPVDRGADEVFGFP